MAWKEADIVAIDEAIKQGATRVRYGDREVVYRSLDEMLRLRDVMKSSVRGKAKPTAHTFSEYSRGYE